MLGKILLQGKLCLTKYELITLNINFFFKKMKEKIGV